MERSMMADVPIHVTPEDLSERALVKGCQEGDKGAFKVLVDRYQHRAVRVAHGFVRGEDDAREVVQEAFVRVFQSINGFRNESPFYTWFYGILVNVALDHLRRSKSPAEGVEDGLLLRRAIASDVQGAKEGAREEIGTQQRRKAIVDAIDSLPIDQRMAIILREVEKLSYEEIAQFTKVPIGTVMSRVFDARRMLQVKLGE